MVAPTFGTIHSVSGYWLGPPVWFGSPRPEPLSVPGLPDEALFAYRRLLAGGGEAVVAAAGIVLVDFDGLEGSGPSDKDLNARPFAHSPASAMASVVAPRRAEILNAHQLCLLDAIGIRESDEDVWSPDPRPVSVPTMWSGWSADQIGVQRNDELGAFLKFLHDTTPIARQLFTFPPEVLDQSFTTFETLLGTPVAAIRACHCLLLAADHYRHWRFDQALTLAWAASEAVFTQLWMDHAAGAANAAGYPLNSERRGRLRGPEFTASVVIESLAIAGIIDRTLHKDLTAIRGTRNRWVHGLEPVPESAAASAFMTGQALVGLLTDCHMTVPLTLAAPRLS
jgi:hypothetical protein